MKDWKEWFDLKAHEESINNPSTFNALMTEEEIRYKAYEMRVISKLIDEGFIEANPVRWKRPDINEIFDYFVEKLGDEKGIYEANGFFTYWESLDWMVRKTRIKSWKGRAATWIKNNETYKRDNARNNQEFDHESTEWGKGL